jgi:hypothetical protein
MSCSLQQFLRHSAIVEGNDDIAHRLSRFMTLPRDDDYVTRGRRIERQGDGPERPARTPTSPHQ